MIALATDTTTTVNTVAVCDGEYTSAEAVVECGRKHSERLLATTDWVLSEAGLGLRDVDLLAVSVGPGSFTGVRIGVSVWKGLALASGLPLAGVSTLDALARPFFLYQGCLCCLVDAKMGEVFGCPYVFEGGTRRRVAEERVSGIDAFLENASSGTYFLGSGALRYADAIRRSIPGAIVLPPWAAVPRGSAVAMEGMALAARGGCTDPARVTPVYLRKSQAETARDGAGPR